jgi:hypothetical protein
MKMVIVKGQKPRTREGELMATLTEPLKSHTL